MINPAQPAHRSSLDELLTSHKAAINPLKLAVTQLCHGWQHFDDLVRTTALPRRTVEELLHALGDDLARVDNVLRIQPSARNHYDRFKISPQPQPYANVLDHYGELVERVGRQITHVPPPLMALDHVQATAETVVRRALWLSDRYDLTNIRLLFLGDHDLTSLAVQQLCPRANITVVDLDDRLLNYLDQESEYPLTLLHADFRFGIPPALVETVDVVFSDPPYTPEGMGLFAHQGIQALKTPHLGRLALAYGYSSRHPQLGLQVQQELAGLGLTFEAILPDFNKYSGAQAIGSAADLYVCQPTTRGRSRGKIPKKSRQGGIYTHGPQSVESKKDGNELLLALQDIAGKTGLSVKTHSAQWNTPLIASNEAVAINLTADPGFWLSRILLATNAPRLAVLVPNTHPDITNAEAQSALSNLLAKKYRLRFLRSTPDNQHAVVVADAVSSDEQHPLLHKAHGKLGNVWRESIVTTSEGRVSKNEARQHIDNHLPGLGSYRLIDLPRHRISQILASESKL